MLRIVLLRIVLLRIVLLRIVLLRIVLLSSAALRAALLWCSYLRRGFACLIGFGSSIPSSLQIARLAMKSQSSLAGCDPSSSIATLPLIVPINQE